MITHPAKVELTKAEKAKLARIVRRAVKAQRDLWDVLNEIGERIDADWEPSFETGASCDVVHNLAVDEYPRKKHIIAAFTQSQDWESGSAE